MFKLDNKQSDFSYSNIVFNANMIHLLEKAMALIGPTPYLFIINGTGRYNQQATLGKTMISCQILAQFHYASMKLNV